MAFQDADILTMLEQRWGKRKLDPYAYFSYPYMFRNPWISPYTGFYGGGFPSGGLDMYGSVPFGGALTGGESTFYPSNIITQLLEGPGESTGITSGLTGEMATDPNALAVLGYALAGIPSEAGKAAFPTPQTTLGKILSLSFSPLIGQIAPTPIPGFWGMAKRGVINPVINAIETSLGFGNKGLSFGEAVNMAEAMAAMYGAPTNQGLVDALTASNLGLIGSLSASDALGALGLTGEGVGMAGIMGESLGMGGIMGESEGMGMGEGEGMGMW